MAVLRTVAGATAALALTFGGAAAAQTSRASAPQAELIDELVVHARLPGPAWWRVSDGDTTVYVLGVPEALPKDLAWDKSVLERRLEGANRVILPPEAGVGVTDLPAVLSMALSMRSDVSLAATLPEDLRQRYLLAVQRTDGDAGRYDRMKPLGAAAMLAARFRKSAGLEVAEPEDQIRLAAKRAGVRAEPVYRMRARETVRMAKAASQDIGYACLSQALAQMEAGAGPARAAARAWAEGDVRGALAGGGEPCGSTAPGVEARSEAVTEAGVTAIEEALSAPGHAVAVMDLRSVVARGGVLDRLKAKGFAVQIPEA